jgi:hypothetical protein
MTPPKNHAVGDPLIVVHLESKWFICCNFDGKLIKIIKEHMYLTLVAMVIIASGK